MRRANAIRASTQAGLTPKADQRAVVQTVVSLFEAFTNALAVQFDSAIVVPVIDVLQQMRHSRK